MLQAPPTFSSPLTHTHTASRSSHAEKKRKFSPWSMCVRVEGRGRCPSVSKRRPLFFFALCTVHCRSAFLLPPLTELPQHHLLFMSPPSLCANRQRDHAEWRVLSFSPSLPPYSRFIIETFLFFPARTHVLKTPLFFLSFCIHKVYLSGWTIWDIQHIPAAHAINSFSTLSTCTSYNTQGVH